MLPMQRLPQFFDGEKIGKKIRIDFVQFRVRQKGGRNSSQSKDVVAKYFFSFNRLLTENF
jgi:hypothetical protein